MQIYHAKSHEILFNNYIFLNTYNVIQTFFNKSCCKLLLVLDMCPNMSTTAPVYWHWNQKGFRQSRQDQRRPLNSITVPVIVVVVVGIGHDPYTYPFLSYRLVVVFPLVTLVFVAWNAHRRFVPFLLTSLSISSLLVIPVPAVSGAAFIFYFLFCFSIFPFLLLFYVF